MITAPAPILSQRAAKPKINQPTNPPPPKKKKKKKKKTKRKKKKKKKKTEKLQSVTLLISGYKLPKRIK